MIGLVRNEWKKVFLPVLLTTVLLAIAMGVLSCTIYQNYVLHYDLEAWEVGTELFSLLYPLFVVVPLCWNLYWQTAFNILFNSNVVFAIFLLIVLAPVFSEEYSSGAANVILSTRYGKSKVIQAKFTAAFLIAAISAVIFCVVILLACGAYFAGFEGWNADIQTQFMSNQSQIPIRMNNLQFFLVVMLFYWLSAVGTAVLACCCSALCKKSLIALIMSGVLYFLPYFPMKLGGVLGEWMFIFPIWSAKAQWVLRTAEHKLVNLLPLSCEMPVWIVIFTLIFTVVSFLITCKSFSEYQGT